MPSTNFSAVISWSAIVSNKEPNLTLSFVNPFFSEGNNNIVLPKGLSSFGEDRWANTLVGFSLEKRLPLSVLITKIESIWAQNGLMDVTSIHDGFLLFKFKSQEDVEVFIKKAPWFFNGNDIHLQPWSRNFDFLK